MTLPELIAALEKAEGPSRELDAEIAVRLRFPAYKYPKSVLNRKPSSWAEALERLTHDGFGGGERAPRFTSSIDAALTLVPDGWAWQVGPFNFNRVAVAQLAEPADDVHGFGPGIKARSHAEHTVPAIALTIAALKAREALKEFTP